MNTFPDPATALQVFAAIALAAAVVFWPRRGIVARIRRAADLSERVRLEDGIKYIFNGTSGGRPASVDGLAGAIGVSSDRAVDVLRHLERLGLARLEGSDITLTGDGRAQALRLVRTHRIWERYLADRTGVASGEWHAVADRLEHGLGPDEVDRLAASMGDPLYDPHGDPIPTASGALPPARGVPLAGVGVGTAARVVHVEDEPHEVYRSLLAAGIGAGCRLRLERIDAAGFHLVVEGRRVAIDAVAALNLSVEPDGGAVADEGLERLDALRPREEGVVVAVGAQIQGAQRRRLLDLGVVPGTVIRAELSSLSGDPTAYRIRGAVIALRRAQSGEILIRRRASKEAA
jgi:DtxR family transcriptional regulator, Mn-dependent transcriptional regulator